MNQTRRQYYCDDKSLSALSIYLFIIPSRNGLVLYPRNITGNRMKILQPDGELKEWQSINSSFDFEFPKTASRHSVVPMIQSQDAMSIINQLLKGTTCIPRLSQRGRAIEPLWKLLQEGDTSEMNGKVKEAGIKMGN
jgi:hypothetical protein